MEKVKRLTGWFRRWEYSGLCLLILIILVLHFVIIMQPNQPVFDENHYIPDARRIIQGEGTQFPEHPPLSKLFIVAGIQIFGDNPWGWRLLPIIFSVAGIVFFYLICRRLNLSPKLSYLATFLLALENISFIHGSIAMLDVFSLTFTLVVFWLYLKGRYVMSGVAVGLSALTKLSGALAILVIGLHWLLTGGWAKIWPKWRFIPWFLTSRRHRWRFLLIFLNRWRFLLSMLFAPISFLALMPFFDFAVWHKWLNPITQIQIMMQRTGSIVFSGVEPGTGSRPWEWLFTYPDVIDVMPYWWEPTYTGMISPTIWAFIIPIVIYITYRALKGNTEVLFPFAWFIGTYLVWIPTVLITDRVTYIFYIYPTIGAITIGLSIALFQLLDLTEARQKGKLRWSIKLGVSIYLLLHIAAFIIITPCPPLSLVLLDPPYFAYTISSIWWSIPLYLLLYIFTLRFLGIIKWPRFGGSIALPENQVDMPPRQ